ncbi:hypothetical protein BpHYR1_028686, partial [Brachionus plicatilis]
QLADFYWLHAYICYNFKDYTAISTYLILQGLEKLNDQTTNDYFKSSNKGSKTMEQFIGLT